MPTPPRTARTAGPCNRWTTSSSRPSTCSPPKGQVHTERDHVWHMDTLARLAAADPALLRATATLRVDVTDAESVAAGVAWWEEPDGARR